MKTLLLSLLFLSQITWLSAAHAAYAPIVRPYHSVRTAGMGDVRYTTGQYEENFYANPARMAAIPSSRFQMPKISVETGAATLSAASSVSGSSGGLAGVSSSVGKPLSAAVQLTFPGFFKREFLSDMWALGIGVNVRGQAAEVLSQAGTIDPNTLIDAGLSLTIARRLLKEHPLSVGFTFHGDMRASSASTFTLQQFLSGSSISSAIQGGSGLGFDMDFGTSYHPDHWVLLGFQLEVDAAVNNLFGGTYNNLTTATLANYNGAPTPTTRSLGFGVSATHKHVLFFDRFILAAELTDIGNNPNGSIWRSLHLGTEAKWKAISLRAGANQGYAAGGLGFDFGFFDLNLATYGEEMGLNTGDMEDRRYALELGFQI